MKIHFDFFYQTENQTLLWLTRLQNELIKNTILIIHMKDILTCMGTVDYPHPLLPTLRERLHTHKVFTKDQFLYLNYHKFSINSYVLDDLIRIGSVRRF